MPSFHNQWLGRPRQIRDKGTTRQRLEMGATHATCSMNPPHMISDVLETTLSSYTLSKGADRGAV